jgi:hypothetical protein
MSCQKKDRLERRYTHAVERLDSARKCLLDRIAICSQAELLAWNDEVDCACNLLNNARAMLDEHVRQHCCWAKDTDSTTG